MVEVEELKAAEVKLNKQMDLGQLIYEDSSSYEGITREEFAKRTAENLCTIYKTLFELKRNQDLKHGEDGEILEYSKSAMSVTLPKPTTVLPREKPAPKEKAMTKWEKFREEKGIAPRKKRSRLVYDPITADWVPRWGKGSVKKIEEKQNNWVMPEKPKHLYSGMDPFEYARMEKKGKLEKQNLAQIANEVSALKPNQMKNQVQVLGAKKFEDGTLKPKATMEREQKEWKKRENNPTKAVDAVTNSKIRQDDERNNLRKREHKSLMKSLTMAQMSTASMGKFDKKLRAEPDAPKTQKIVPKKSNKALGDLEVDRKGEKSRNLKIFDFMQRKSEQKLQERAAAPKPLMASNFKKKKTGKRNWLINFSQ